MADKYEMPPEGFTLDPIGQEPAPAPTQETSKYAAPPANFQLAPMPGEAVKKPIPPVPQGVLSATQVAQSAYEHLIPSAIKTGKELAYPFMHPQETLEGVKTLASGLASKAGIRDDVESEKALSAIGDYYKQRYGGIEEAKRAFAEDPVGVASDVATIFTGGGGAMKGLAKGAELAGMARTATGLGKAGEIIGETGRLVDPVTASTKLGAMAAEPITKGVTPAILSFKSGKTIKSLQDAEEAGVTSNPEFWRHFSGEANPQEVIDAVKDSINKIKDERSQQYFNSSQGWKSSQAQLDMMPTVNSYMKELTAYSPSGKTPIYMQAPMKDIGETLRHWGGSNKTMSDFDFLKRDLDKLYNSPNFRGNPEAQAVLTKVRNQAWQTIVDHDPKYAEIMKNYENATKELGEITSEVGTNKAAATTRLKKLIKANDKKTIDRLIQENPNLPYMIAGQELNPLVPEGLRGALLSSLAYSIPAMAFHPGAFVGVAGASPKIAGGLQYGLGAARTLPMQAEKMAIPQATRRAAMAAEQPFMEEEQPVARATGGRVMTADRMMSMAKRAKKEIESQTKALLEEPDEHIVKALKVANEHI
jgi:hypothetical protein